MLYCFIEEDLRRLEPCHPLAIQVNYAKHLGLFCCCSLSDGAVRDCLNQPAATEGEEVFLRGSCDAFALAARLLAAQGIRLLETAGDVEVVERWDALSLTQREIVALSRADVLKGAFSPQCAALLKRCPFVFLKSRKKGFAAQVRSQRLLWGDRELLELLERQSGGGSDELMLSKLLKIRCDSLGTKESRHFVRDGTIVNSSRAVHTVRHTVPRRQVEAAAALVERISRCGAFPKNYVIDVGEFEDDGITFIDLVEINPISSALCYVNNSIFDTLAPEIRRIKDKMGIGAEYCYDALDHPERYSYSRMSNTCYEYVNPEHYSFL